MLVLLITYHLTAWWNYKSCKLDDQPSVDIEESHVVNTERLPVRDLGGRL